MEAQLTSTTPLLRTDQIEEMEGEREALQRKLNNPRIEDKGAVAEQLRRVDRQLESQRPTPYPTTEIDRAVREEAELRAEWTDGMLSAEEMRKCPPGAVDRHLAWERKNIKKIERWQNIMRRLNAGSDAREVASIERFRPQVSNLSMNGALIPGKNYFLPPADAAMPVVFSDADLEAIRAKRPEIAGMLFLMDNVQRAQAKALLIEQGVLFASKSAEAGKLGADRKAAKRTMSPEHKAKMLAGAKAAREKKAA